MQTVLVLAAIRAGLWILPFRLVRRLVPIGPQPLRRQSAASVPERISLVARNVRIGSQYVPGATCLTQALSAQLLLSRAGLTSMLHIGVARSADGTGIRAHAWLDSHGTTVTGGYGICDFVELPSLKK